MGAGEHVLGAHDVDAVASADELGDIDVLLGEKGDPAADGHFMIFRWPDN